MASQRHVAGNASDTKTETSVAVAATTDSTLLSASVGSIASIMSMTLCYPLDILRTKLQVDDGDANAMQKVRELIQDRGLSGMYRGILPVLQTVGISQFLYFYIFTFAKALRIGDRLLVLVNRTGDTSDSLQSFLGSLIAGVVNMLFTEPLWKSNVFCQTRIKKMNAAKVGSTSSPADDKVVPESAEQNQAETTMKMHEDNEVNVYNIFSVVSHLAKKHGLTNLWSGLGTSMWLVSNPVIQYAMYDVLKTRTAAGGQISPAKGFLLGAFSKAVATVLTYPLQVAQSRLRASTDNISMFQALRQIYIKDKLPGYFKGIGPKLVQTVLNAAFMFYFFEALLTKARRLRGWVHGEVMNEIIMSIIFPTFDLA